MILPPTSEISHHHKVTNITMSTTSLSSCAFCIQYFISANKCKRISSFEKKIITSAYHMPHMLMISRIKLVSAARKPFFMLLEQLLVDCVGRCCYDFEHDATVLTAWSKTRIDQIQYSISASFIVWMDHAEWSQIILNYWFLENHFHERARIFLKIHSVRHLHY